MTVDENDRFLLSGVNGVCDIRLTADALGLPQGETLYAIADGALANAGDKATMTLSSGIPLLIGFDEGTPFSFGMADDKIHVECGRGNDESDIIQAWTLPMIGYDSTDALRTAVANELDEPEDSDAVQQTMMTRLLGGENRVRALLGLDTIADTDDMTFRLNTEYHSNSGQMPDWGGDFNWPWDSDDGISDVEGLEDDVIETAETVSSAEAEQPEETDEAEPSSDSDAEAVGE